MSKRSYRIESHVSREEKEYIVSMAHRGRISVSELLRRVVTGTKLPSPERFEAIKNLIKVNADLARLGNLLKLALDDERTNSNRINELIDDVTRDRLRLKSILHTLHDNRKT